ncbi:PINIT domain-containing protein [Cunninghamella echinulata]|nr:PINIT domain-containing protein [Cunninghamella echinulata]
MLLSQSQELNLNNCLRLLHVPELKGIISKLNETFHWKLLRTGRKNEIIFRIIVSINKVLESGNSIHITMIFDILRSFQCRIPEDVKVLVPQSLGTANQINNNINNNNSNNNNNIPSTLISTVPRPINDNRNGNTNTTINRYDSIIYKESPFYTPIYRLTSPKICSASLGLRTSVVFNFKIGESMRLHLTERHTDDDKPLYQIRFFCASHSEGIVKDRYILEFPTVCEISINSEHTINGNAVRGMKNKPGTANPPDITRWCRVQSDDKNSLTLLYANTDRPFIGSIELVKRHPVSEIVNTLKSSKILSKEETLQRLKERYNDSDIVLEAETISVKCPLGFTRIQTPARFKSCQHLQCFDATTFLLMNEQTPTWACPVCNRQMESWEGLCIDEYFTNILEKIPNNLETIKIGENGDLDLTNNKMASTSRSSSTSFSTSESSNTNNNRNGKRPIEKVAHSVTILDDDDDSDNPDNNDDSNYRNSNDPQIKKQNTNSRSPSFTSRNSYPLPSSNQSQYIDLTISSDEEDNGGDNSIEQLQKSVKTSDISNNNTTHNDQPLNYYNNIANNNNNHTIHYYNQNNNSNNNNSTSIENGHHHHSYHYNRNNNNSLLPSIIDPVLSPTEMNQSILPDTLNLPSFSSTINNNHIITSPKPSYSETSTNINTPRLPSIHQVVSPTIQSPQPSKDIPYVDNITVIAKNMQYNDQKSHNEI